MKTTHQLAQELLSLPDVKVIVELWCGSDPVAVMTGYDPDNTAIIMMQEHWDQIAYERTYKDVA